MSITSTPRRRRIGVASIVIGATVLALGLTASPALADPGDPVFGAGFDTYLHDPHRGVTADGFDDGSSCPENAAVEGMTAWHFVLPGSSHAFQTLDVAFELDGDAAPEILAGLTPKTDFTGFDPTLHFIAQPTGKHAYVYTSGDASVMLLDAAAQVSPNATLDKFVLSHACPGTPGGDDTTGGTDTTGGPTTGTDTGAVENTDEEVLGEVVTPQELPATGSSDRSLALLGGALVAVGAVFLVSKRRLLSE